MNDKILKFPKGFLWGAATSSHQIEGGLTNDWSDWEQSPLRIAQLEAEGKDPKLFISGVNSRSYEMNHLNIECLEKINATCYRFSTEWSRVEPTQGDFQAEVGEHYRKFTKELKAKGIEPFVTLWHWPIPLWMRDMGGWESAKILPYFERYVRFLVTNMPEVKFWMPLNEPLVYTSMSYLTGQWPPQKKNPIAVIRVIRNLIKAHKIAYRVIKEINPEAQVGIAKHNTYFEAMDESLINRSLNKLAWYWWNNFFLIKTKKHLDFIGLNYYFHNLINYGFNKDRGDYTRHSDMGWALVPEGLYHLLLDLRKYDLPVYITEHGLADRNDEHREWYIRESLQWIHRAIEDGVDLRGYQHWSLIDNFEWSHGYEKCFGLFEVDYDTLERKPRPSAEYFAKIAKENEISQ